MTGPSRKADTGGPRVQQVEEAHTGAATVASETAAESPLLALRKYLDALDEQTRLPGERPLREAVAEQARERLAEMDEDPDLMDLCQCQGCGEYRSTRWLGMAHACHRAEDGSYEEGGTFQ